MQRGLIALTAVAAVGLGVAAPALASDSLVATGNATSITADSADLNGVVYRDRVGARWLFEYSVNPRFNGSVLSTGPVSIHGRLTAVERQVTGLLPATTYYWRVVLVVRSGTRTAQTFGSTSTLLTTAAGAPTTTTGTTNASTSSTSTTPGTTTSPATTTTSTTPSPAPAD